MTDPAAFSVHVELEPLRVVVAGELDLVTSEALSAALAPIISDPSHNVVRFDFSGVSFMDSSGLAALLQVVEAGREVVLCGAAEPVRRVVEATGLESVIQVEP
ncbi:MAG: STAS domain-containing protein [Acidimicrobiia bacterium]|jgi:anti-anti-sigma factor